MSSHIDSHADLSALCGSNLRVFQNHMACRAVPGMLERVLALWPGLRWRLGILRALLVSAAAAQTIPVLGSSRNPAEPSIAETLLQQVQKLHDLQPHTAMIFSLTQA